MQIVVNVDPAGQINLSVSEDQPWTAVQILRAVIAGIEAEQAKKEQQSGPRLLVANGPLPRATG